MSCANRTFPDIGKKMLSLTPLGKQRVSPSDSVLGPLASSRTNPLLKGLSVTYQQMIQDAFVNSWWDSVPTVTVGRPRHILRWRPISPSFRTGSAALRGHSDL